MIGNVWETTAEWYAAPALAAPGVNPTWPGPEYQGDGLYEVASGAFPGFGGDRVTGLPAAAGRGGHDGNGAAAGDP